MEGKLFSQDFLLDGIKTKPVWEALSEQVLDVFVEELQRIYAPLAADSWRDLTLSQNNASSKRRDDMPDFLLFPNEESKLAARAEKREDARALAIFIGVA